jgi:hypothetical protein
LTINFSKNIVAPQAPSIVSRLLNLPIEVRFTIYKKLFEGSHLYVQSQTRAGGQLRLVFGNRPCMSYSGTCSWDLGQNQHQILFTCRLCFQEALRLFLSSTFWHTCASWQHDRPTSFQDFVLKQSAIAATIKYLELDNLSELDELNVSLFLSLEVVIAWATNFMMHIDKEEAPKATNEDLIQTLEARSLTQDGLSQSGYGEEFQRFHELHGEKTKFSILLAVGFCFCCWRGDGCEGKDLLDVVSG